jgi:hypothetical protein
MENSVSIAMAIAGLNCDDEIKKYLRTLFNEELNGTTVSQIFYVKHAEIQAQAWTQKSVESE